MHAQVVTPSKFIDDTQLSSLQIITLVLCFFVVAADGFDVASVGYVAPLLKKAWSLGPAQLGPIFGAGLFGLTVGSFLFGPLADRIGRKRVIMISLVLFGIGSFACAYAPSLTWLILLRFATGAGLGGAMPNAITLSSEFSPARNRAWMVTLMFCGFTLGLAFGGAIAALLIPTFGWKGVFVFGGLFPLCLIPIVWLWLPESLRFMAGKPRYRQETRQVLKRLTGDPDTPLEQVIPEDAKTASGDESAVRALFNPRYRTGTLLMWVAFFCTLWVYYQVSSWLPTVITGAGIDAAHAARVGAMLPLGGTVGSLINARLMDRVNQFVVLAVSYAVAAVSIALIGFSINEPAWVYVAVFMAGLGLSGAQSGANVLVAGFYTTAARATGVSWALAVGRIGSIIGSMTGGILLATFHSVELAFVTFAAPALIAGVAMLANGWFYRGSNVAKV
ncbi:MULTISPECIES: MFS transporter [Paraburkholderia]|uniref:3-hydroxybenzoate transporter MhbT n=1 Tax=Paraburkholderia nemoris TaxID=2793076 RepID=A0ABN7N7Z8_9BURK|nr:MULTISPECIES: MFS transporter [Paraburkholderia]KPD15132.1 4-hydroxybenzoate transporter [Burkholderia sp. ST111]MBK5152650.1 MFS transporter [Burkholderia sp. R-69608]MBK5184480.1 MFS transporter [Burkholderia sp. R-69749]MBK3816111.1 MFS transporter [Paraburkholderia aspalathi]CAE6854792.1 3-hydroxybenzoate transporter MhbT [Paraburkholderia nemoris]